MIYIALGWSNSGNFSSHVHGIRWGIVNRNGLWTHKLVWELHRAVASSGWFSSEVLRCVGLVR